MITKAGELVDHIAEAAQRHGCAPTSEVFVRVGALGLIYRINCLKGMQDERGFRLVVELWPLPEIGA